MYNAPKEVAKSALAVCFLLTAASLVLTPGAGWAQSPPKGRSVVSKATEAPKARRAQPPGRVIELEGDEIVGKVPKPQVFYLLGRSESHYRGLRVKKSFVRQIVDTLKRNPL